MHTVEPVFGTLQQYYGLRWINTRGRDCANKLMLMSASALNLKKWMKNEFEKVKNDLYLVIFTRRYTMSDLMPINKIIKPTLFIFVFLIIGCNQNDPINGITKFKDIDSVSDFASELWIEGNTFKGSFSDDYCTFFFFRKVALEVEKYVPYKSNYINGKWEEPKIMDYYNNKNSYTYQLKVPNSSKLYVLSNKKTKKDTAQNPNYNFWEIELKDNSSTEPKELGYKNLIYNYNSQPCITKKGTLFFTSDVPDWSQTLSYKMELINEVYSEPQLFEPVNEWRKNEDWVVYEFCVSPNEDYIIVCIQKKNEDKKLDELSTNLYISYLRDSKWTFPKQLGTEINTNETENFPTITNDGKFLMFTRAFSKFKIVSTKQLE